ncbi:hypothetical protein [Streptomyces spectabilis]|uniref:Uncharacterized protein n=1 Tax=Streptomyces spectabilis TaxID=68270 RepID=A0A7W8B626_STRST|nr:hypothetical protein [Streptomyces spectabilis]MBB5109835.1 hypothetical protein [Streptomyces spectabilis]
MGLSAAAPAHVEDPRTRQLVDDLEPEFLKLVEWDWSLRVIFFPKDHPVLGMPDCRVNGCVRGARFGHTLCMGCEARWKESGQGFEDFIKAAKGRMLGTRQQPCRVPGCQRPWKSSRLVLCEAHNRQRVDTLKLSLEDFLRHPAVKPREMLGECEVPVCYRQRQYARARYCQAHALRWKAARRRGKTADEEAWRLGESAINADREVSLRGLPERVVAEILYGLQARTAAGSKTWD